jgi:hypothetical protein
MRNWRATHAPTVPTVVARADALKAKAKRKPHRPTPTTPGSVEHATIQGCEPYAQDRPAMVAMARELASILDNTDMVGLHVQSARQLSAILNTLCAPRKPKSRGRLAAVRNPTVATAK